MSRLEVRPFAADDIPAAAELLAQRHRRHRQAQPLLSPRYEHASAAEEAVRAAAEAEHASGAVALRGGALVGYLIGSPKTSYTWGENMWVEAAGQAADEPEAMRELYALAADRWVAEGRKAHYVLTPADDVDLVRAWFRVGFGQQHAHGLRALPRPGELAAPKVSIRRAERADIPVLAELDIALPEHQARTPVFSAARPPTLQESLGEWGEDFDDPDFTTFVAVHDGEVIGSAVGCALEKSGSHTTLARPENAGFLGFAAVLPHARGLGAGRTLGEAVLAWAAETGYASVVTDWRVTNLLSSRAWPALGFQESFVRLHRLVGY
ncbi:GNAT family N-acetyltransferase [Catellatospora sp. KI3]|uniref:GNAT family N-acetyltransferase n=1 Tax=Catellatospora sp. KI3 TaxID=3041620 RepID=UPI002482F962|nr:GNAT family N-acetyltransferase [Catellatospora sp. KI3]MDI1466309.1 GNAT family N-acetyltransferase [Catellatospora sp. KI3]